MTKIKKVENHLLTGKKLTKRHAVHKWNYYNLGDGILKLRHKYGADRITTKMVKSGDTIHAEYRMNK